MCRVDASKIDFVRIEELGQIGFCEKRLGIAVSTVRTHKDTDEASSSPQYAAVISRPPATEEEEEPKSAAPRSRSEADLRGRLNNDSLSEDEIRQIEEDRAKAEAAAQLREEDYQLAYAIDILKGLSAIDHRN